jgi:cytochrome c oxidase subunit 3
MAEPFPSPARQREAGRLGMLVFLASEVMLFGGIFAGALSLRLAHPGEYAAASREMHLWLGGINTAILLTSSALAALAVEAVRHGLARAAGWLLAGTIALALAFLAIKASEYALEYHDGVVPGLSDANLHGGPHELFMNLYFASTGLHALHVTAGIVLLASMIWPFGAARRDRQAVTIGNAALYWHLVDVVWIFLYPTLYLAR